MRNESIVDAWNRLGPDAVAENRVMAIMREKQSRRSRLSRWTIPASAAAVLALAVLAGTMFSLGRNAFTLQAYALEETSDGHIVLRETDLFDQSAGWGGYYDGERLFVSIGMRYDGRNIKSVRFSTETGFFAVQHISDYDDADGVTKICVGSDDKPVMIGEDFEILGAEVSFDGTMDDDLLLFWGTESPDGDYIPENIELLATATFRNGETQTLPLSVPLKGENVGVGVIAYDMGEDEATDYVKAVEYYKSLPAEAWGLIEDSVAPVTDGWYVYFWEKENNDIQVQAEDLDFDEDGNFVSVFPALKVVIHRDDDGSLTGMVYHVPEKLMYDPEG